jgi:predicted DNA-binding protein
VCLERGLDFVMSMVRVNTRISRTLNEWLDEQSQKTGIPKSTLIHLALEQYVQQKETVDTMALMMSKLDNLEQALKSGVTPAESRP